MKNVKNGLNILYTSIKSKGIKLKDNIIESIENSPVIQIVNIIGILFSSYIILFDNTYSLTVFSLILFIVSFVFSITSKNKEARILEY